MKCKKCGHNSDLVKAEILNEEEEWINITCKKCNSTLFYNGA